MPDGRPTQYRDTFHAVGTAAALSNRREGTLEITVPPPDRDPDPALSPWEGMSRILPGDEKAEGQTPAAHLLDEALDGDAGALGQGPAGNLPRAGTG